MIIDFHTHIGDIINGTEPSYGEDEKPKRRVEYLFQLMGYRNIFGKIPSWLNIPLAVEIQNRHAWSTKGKLLESMKRNKIDVSIVLPIEPIQKTEEVLKECDGETLIPFASVSPLDPDKGEKLKNYIKHGCKGVKLHPILQRTPPEHKGYFEILEEIKSLNVPVIFHAGVVHYLVIKTPYPEYGKVERLEGLIKSFPDVKFIIAHMGLDEADVAIGMAEKFQNIYLETSFQPFKKILNAIKKIRPKRLLFGSDWPSSFQETPLKIYEKLKVKLKEDINLIMCENTKELLNL